MTDPQHKINEGVIDALEAANNRIDHSSTKLAEEKARSITPQ